jgi:hypothetical protein
MGERKPSDGFENLYEWTSGPGDGFDICYHQGRGVQIQCSWLIFYMTSF